jgi:peptide/nickel transport system permease protein
MAQETLTLDNLPKEEQRLSQKARLSTLTRVLRYTLVRGILLFITVVIGVFLTIMIANMGGYVDEIRRGEIRESVAIRINNDPATKSLSIEVRNQRMADLIRLEEQRLGLNRPFMVRAFGYLRNALTLDLGRSQNMSSDAGSRQVRLILLERLPATLALTGTVSLLLFFIEVFVALILSRKYGSFWDKIIVAMSPTSSVPAWFYGIFLIMIFAAILGWLPYGGMVDAPPPENRIEYLLSMLKHMALPALAWTMSGFFISVFNWRTFFLIYSSEDYVDVAKAKGLNPRDLERRYIMRPTLPYLITSFAFLLIGSWAGAPIFETIFQWPGLGRRLIEAVNLYDTPVIVASTVLFAYLLAISVFLLDFIYALVDPRVKIGSGGSK